MDGPPHKRVKQESLDDSSPDQIARSSHPYLRGNFYPVSLENELTPCEHQGEIPIELHGGQYLRNGGNPQFAPNEGRAYHWFDGDGMLHGVYFRTTESGVQPEYVNRFVLTDAYVASQKRNATVLPSIASLISLDSSKMAQIGMLLHSTYIACLSRVSRLSVANTAVVFHDRRLLATCESGPPLYVTAPELDTVGFHIFADGKTGQGGLGKGKLTVGSGDRWGALPVAAKMLEEWTTAHPKRDPVTGDLVFMGYNIFQRPFVTYSVVAKDGQHRVFKQPINLPSPKMIHDIPVSLRHTIILDLPLCMDPLAPFKPGGKQPMVHFDRRMQSRFGILPRLYTGDANHVKWFEAPPCLIFHAANAWDETLAQAHASFGNQNSPSKADDETTAVCLLACRFLSAKLVHAAGGQRAPAIEEAIAAGTSDGDAVKLTYIRFSVRIDDPLRSASSLEGNVITHQFALSAIPFEFPVVPFQRTMQESRFVFGLSLRSGSFSEALEGAKPDVVVRLDVRALIARGRQLWDGGLIDKNGNGIVDTHSVQELLSAQPRDASIRCFALPAGWYASEPAFVAKHGTEHGDDAQGYLVFYVFDESQLQDNGDVPDTAKSELWVLDAQDMQTIVAKIQLPSRVPYGLHGTWVSKDELASQRHLTDEKAIVSKRKRLHEIHAENRAATASKLATGFSYIDAYTIAMLLGLLAQAIFACVLATRGGVRGLGASQL